MAENLVTPEKSINENDNLHQLTYKEVQQIAMSMKIPANLKHSSLVAVIKAHQSEDFIEVERIVSEHRQMRNRGRLSRTTSTSPAAESLTLSPPMSPECHLHMPTHPLASSSPKLGNPSSVSEYLLEANEGLQLTKDKQIEKCADMKLIPLETAVQLLCKETLQSHEDLGGSPGTLSSDRSPDPLELESPSTSCSDSQTNSAASDVDPLVTSKESLDFSEKETFAKDLTELKPVPPSELMDLSLPEPLIDSSLILRPTLGSGSLQTDSFLHPVHTFTQALVQYPSVEDCNITNNLPVNLGVPDLTIDGLVNSSISEIKRVEKMHAKQSCSDVIPLAYVNTGVPSIVNQCSNSQERQSTESDNHPHKLQKRQSTESDNHPHKSQKRQSTESDNHPHKLQKRQSTESDNHPHKSQKTSTQGNVQPCQVSAVSSIPLSMPLVSQGEFHRLPTSLSIVPVPKCTAAATSASMTVTPVITTAPSVLEGDKVIPSTPNTSTLSGNTLNRSTNPNARKNIVCFTSSPVSFNMTNLPHSSSQSTKTSSSESWLGLLSRSNIQINESSGKAIQSAPAKAPIKPTIPNILLFSKRSAANKSNTLSKKNDAPTTKSSHQEICNLSPDVAHAQFRSMATKSQASPTKKSMANPIPTPSSTGSSPCYARQNIRPPTQHPTTAVTVGTASLNAPRRLEQPAALQSASNVFAAPTFPTRNPPKIATPIPKPGRPESLVNFHAPLFPQPNLPPFNHVVRDQADNQKYVPGRQPEFSPPYSVGHGDSSGELLPSLVQPRVDLGSYTSLQPQPQPQPPTRQPQLDFSPSQTMQSPYVCQAAVGQNASHDGSLSTLRQLLEAPGLNGLSNRDPAKRNPFYPHQFDYQNINQFIRPQPSDHYKDMTGIGQPGNIPFQTQNIQRMPFIPIKSPESTERLLKAKEFLTDQRLGSTDLPKNLESIFNYRSDALSDTSTTFPKNAVPSSAIDSLFVSSGVGPTFSVNYYVTPICSVKSKPTRMCHMGIGSHQPVDRQRSPQDFVPYSSNYQTEQHCADIYGLPSMNPAVLSQQSCEPSWLANEPCLSSAMPVNQYWPQAVNHQPVMRFPHPQPFRAVNPRNMPNHYYSPLKSLQMSSVPVFFNQPPINNVAYQGGMPQSQPPPPPPLPDVQSYQLPESFDKVLPLQENIVQLVGQDTLVGPNQAMNQCQNQIHQDVPDFQGRGDQLSLSMIYNYLASTEHQMAANTPRPDQFDNQSQMNQRPVYSRPIFPGTIAGQYQQQFGNESTTNATPQQSSAVASASSSRSKYSNASSKNVTRRQEVSECTTLTKEAATLSVIALRKHSKERQKCVNFANGCSLTLPLSQLAAHEVCCEYINLKCPKETCDWNGRARKLANHVREAHRLEINSGTDSKHSLPDIEALEKICFLQEVSRKLFAICVNCHGGVLYVSIQYIASGRSERPTSACGCIEVLGHDGHPHSWRGKLLPYYQSVEALLTTSSCLEVSLNTLGAFPGSTITLHVNIRVYSGNTNSNTQPSH